MNTTAEAVYTTSTGQPPRGSYTEDPRLGISILAPIDVDDPHCFVCRRHTDHAGEHSALVEAGLAYYTGDGSVHRSEKWDDEQARLVAEAEYREYRERLGLNADPGDEHL